MAKVHLVKWLCSQRHCLLMSPYVEGSGETFDTSIAKMRWLATMMNLKPFCEICGSVDLRYEDHRTPFDDLKTATPEFAATMFADLLERNAARAAGTTVAGQDRKRRN